MTREDPNRKRLPVLGDAASRHFLSEDDLAYLRGCERFTLLRRLDDSPRFEMDLFSDCEEVACAWSLEGVRILLNMIPWVTHVHAQGRLVLAAALCPVHERQGGVPTRLRDLDAEARIASRPHAPLPMFATLLSAAEADPTQAYHRFKTPEADFDRRSRAYRALEEIASTRSNPSRPAAREMLHYYNTRIQPVAYRALKTAELVASLTRLPTIAAALLALAAAAATALEGFAALTGARVATGMLYATFGLGVMHCASEWSRRRLSRVHEREGGVHYPPRRSLTSLFPPMLNEATEARALPEGQRVPDGVNLRMQMPVKPGSGPTFQRDPNRHLGFRPLTVDTLRELAPIEFGAAAFQVGEDLRALASVMYDGEHHPYDSCVRDAAGVVSWLSNCVSGACRLNQYRSRLRIAPGVKPDAIELLKSGETPREVLETMDVRAMKERLAFLRNEMAALRDALASHPGPFKQPDCELDRETHFDNLYNRLAGVEYSLRHWQQSDPDHDRNRSLA